MVGFWATLSLNIPDFTREAKSQRDQMLGQLIGLNATMPLYAFIGVAVTSATFVIFGETIWDPVQLLARFENPVLGDHFNAGPCVSYFDNEPSSQFGSPVNCLL